MKLPSRDVTLERFRVVRRFEVRAAAAAGVLACCVVLADCAPVAVGAVTGAGLAVAEERSVGNVVDDLTIRTELNHLFFADDVDLYQRVTLSVNEGRVLLKGAVTEPEHRIRASRLAWQADGVREVINELQVTDRGGLVDYARDTWISAQLKTALLFDREVGHLNYSVETVNSVVYLFGIARSEAELARVVEHARAVEDVERVVNHVILQDDPRRVETP